ncbi:tRNA (adenosine(37)-N6)-threonylcarbamoyltransferase complex transferase subunit TsaD [Owenweeksia hongkongensis]|uniref:tRNA (adenosine(37)-N6)-threonylcarbamoyltransferase complex transferase subunit TsaD n=1 Tax=Owenweeksia hongkongensis TaxID=253245 RepID=UPI003A95D492
MEKFILGIESSCDDTSAAVISNTKILANVTANQDIHREFGGVVPELASRAHQQNIVPVVDAALKKSGISSNQLSAIAFTSGPGLMGSLLVGTSFAKSMAMALNIPLIEVNHMQAHILAHFIENEGMETPPFPFLCLTVSGGHTQIVKVNDHFDYELLGETIDDAAGEAFDKAAKIMGLPYPGGPLIDKYAQLGDSSKFSFNKPRMDEYNFSFSGLKTSILYYLQKEVKTNPNFVEENLNDLCASIQRTIMEILFDKLEKASADTGIKHIAIAGGVSANSALRKGLKERENTLGWKSYIPSFEFCTDNGAMIAVSGYFKFLKQNFSEIDVLAQARKKLNAE